MAGVGAIALALFSTALQTGGTNFADRPYLLLLLPLILAPVGILYFETEISIFRAATYLGVNLKKAAEAICAPLNGIWDWENYRANETLDCRLSIGSSAKNEDSEVWGHLLLFTIDSLLVFVLFRYYKKADRMWKALDNALCARPSKPLP